MKRVYLHSTANDVVYIEYVKSEVGFGVWRGSNGFTNGRGLLWEDWIKSFAHSSIVKRIVYGFRDYYDATR